MLNAVSMLLFIIANKLALEQKFSFKQKLSTALVPVTVCKIRLKYEIRVLSPTGQDWRRVCVSRPWRVCWGSAGAERLSVHRWESFHSPTLCSVSQSVAFGFSVCVSFMPQLVLMVKLSGWMIMSRVHRCFWRPWDQTLLAAVMQRAGKSSERRRWCCSSVRLRCIKAFYSFLCCCRTPLHAAAFGGHVDCIQLLLSHDAPVDTVDQSGRTAVMMAAEKGRAEALGDYSFFCLGPFSTSTEYLSSTQFSLTPMGGGTSYRWAVPSILRLYLTQTQRNATLDNMEAMLNVLLGL